MTHKTLDTLVFYRFLLTSHDLMKNVVFHNSFIDTGNAINMGNAISDKDKKC